MSLHLSYSFKVLLSSSSFSSALLVTQVSVLAIYLLYGSGAGESGPLSGGDLCQQVLHELGQHQNLHTGVTGSPAGADVCQRDCLPDPTPHSHSLDHYQRQGTGSNTKH